MKTFFNVYVKEKYKNLIKIELFKRPKKRKIIIKNSVNISFFEILDYTLN